MIPRILHQTEEEWSTLPLPVKDSLKHMRSNNPDFDVRFYDAGARWRIISENLDPRLAAAYERINPAYGAAKADFFRYCFVLLHGEVYLDAKSRFSAPLSRVIEGCDNLVALRPKNFPKDDFRGHPPHHFRRRHGNLVSQCFFAAPPGDPLLGAVLHSVLQKIEGYSPGRDGIGTAGVFNVTGPKAFTDAIVASPPGLSFGLLDPDATGFQFTGGAVKFRVRPAHRKHYSHLTEDVVLSDQASLGLSFSRMRARLRYGPGIAGLRLKEFIRNTRSGPASNIS